jgi:hypothetical protein
LMTVMVPSLSMQARLTCSGRSTPCSRSR